MYLKLHFLKKIFLIYIKKLKNFIYATLIKIFNKIQLSKEKKFFSIQPNKYCNKVKKNLELFILNKFFMTDIISKQKLDIVIFFILPLHEIREQFLFFCWIKNINLKKEFNHYVILSVPTRFVRDWIVSRYADKILDVIKIYKKSIQRLEFLIEETQEKSDQFILSKKNKITSIENSLLNYNRFSLNNRFDNFVVGESNELAYTAARKICVESAHYNPLFIYSSVGMGKTHLLNAIGLEVRNSKKVMFISAERFI